MTDQLSIDTSADPGSVDAVASSLLVTPAPAQATQDDEKKNLTPAPKAAPQEDGQNAAPAEEATDQVDEEQVGEGDEPDAGVEGDEKEADGSEEHDTSVHRVKVDGKEVEVTLADLKRSYSGQAYVQKQIETTAAARKEAETVFTALQQERAQVAQFAQMLQQFGPAILEEPQKPDPKMLDLDPIKYFADMEAYREAVDRRTAFAQQYAEMNARQEAVQGQARQAYLAQQAQALQEAIPEFKDPAKAKALKADLLETGVKAYGYTPEEMSQVMDARAVRVLHDAMQWRNLQAQKEVVKQKLADARPLVKPGTPPSPQRVQARKVEQTRDRMRKTGSVDDVAAYLLTP